LLTGARRSGKSTLAYRVIKSLQNDIVPPEAILFINLDEPLFQSKSNDLAYLTEIREYYLALRITSKLYLFIDKIQNYDYLVQTITLITIYSYKT